MATFITRSLPRLSRYTAPSTRILKPLASSSRLPHQFFAPFSSTPSVAMASNPVIELVKGRRTYYALNKDLAVPKERVIEIVKEAVQHTPTSFNMQHTRAVVVFDENHDKVWDFTTEILKTIVPAESWEPTAQRMAGFKGGAATVLFFEDQSVVETMQKNIPLYAANFPTWATQAGAMLQFVVWTALEAEGFGANLQHYNPLIDAKIAEAFDIPASWKLTSQLVIGGRAASAGEKAFEPIENKFKVFGA